MIVLIMIHIYGDSHGKFSFKGLTLPHKDYHEPSVTMFRIGRDNVIVNFDKSHNNKGNIFCLVYGEVDCRCHIQKQINAGRIEDYIIQELVHSYFKTIKNNITEYKKIIVVGVIPPTNQSCYENIHGPILHEFPFIGTDEERVRYTQKVNKIIQELCNRDGYIYFNPYEYYTAPDGTLKYELSDTIVHLGDTSIFLHRFNELYKLYERA